MNTEPVSLNTGPLSKFDFSQLCDYGMLTILFSGLCKLDNEQDV